jgi:hypothetical protein
MSFNCLYCKKELTKDSYFDDIYYCSNHKNIFTIYSIENDNNIFYIEMRNSKYCIIQYPELKSMVIIERCYGNCFDFLLKTTLDSNLTPKNFENKLKTYLNFQ